MLPAKAPAWAGHGIAEGLAVADVKAAVGQLCPGDPFGLLALVVGMSCAWSPASGVYAATADEPAADCERDGGHLAIADLDRERIYRKPVLGGLINECSRAA
jgi:hypothetical protein